MAALTPSPADAASAAGPGAAAIRVDRAGTELRRGRPLVLAVGGAAGSGQGHTASGRLLVAAVETLSETLLQQLLQAGTAPQLLLSAERLCALGGPAAAAPCALALPAGITLLQLQQLAAVLPGPGDRNLLRSARPCTSESPAWPALLALCKRARLIPAVLMVHAGAEASAALAEA